MIEFEEYSESTISILHDGDCIGDFFITRAGDWKFCIAVGEMFEASLSLKELEQIVTKLKELNGEKTV